MKKLLLFVAIVLLNSCITEETTDAKVMGYRPIYASYDEIRKVVSLAPQKLRKPGKIYTKDKYLYINEIGEGIHVFDNSDKTKPKAICKPAPPRTLRADTTIPIKVRIIAAKGDI